MHIINRDEEKLNADFPWLTKFSKAKEHTAHKRQRKRRANGQEAFTFASRNKKRLTHAILRR